MRLFQESGKIYADEMIVHDSSAKDIDKELFYSFYEKQYGNLARESKLNLAGLLLFGKNLQNLKKIQKGRNFNTPGVLEVSEIALQEILVNALVHRDYFIGAPIRI